MKGKLIKVEDGYNLFIEQPQGRLLEATCSISEIKRLEENNVSFKKLSIKNCEAIENGYDLEELACDKIGIDISVLKHIDSKLESHSSPCVPLNEGGCVGAGLYHMVKGFEIGFQKALEILTDKKFSEEDVISMIEKSRKTGLTSEYIILTQQQTEFDVEVEQELIHSSIEGEAIWKTKLDADGCLILRRI